MNDIVIPYKKNNSGELEACISLIKKNVPHRNIHVIERSMHPVSHIDQILKLKWAMRNLELTESFYLFNDDFFVLEPIENVPPRHRGTITEHLNSRIGTGIYTRSLRTTRDILDVGALSYELHIPILFEVAKLTFAINLIENDIAKKNCPLIRSFYGNLFKIGGEYMDDVKNIEDFIGATYLSTTEATFKRSIGDYIRSRA